MGAGWQSGGMSCRTSILGRSPPLGHTFVGKSVWLVARNPRLPLSASPFAPLLLEPE